jgi:hypothetical protein
VWQLTHAASRRCHIGAVELAIALVSGNGMWMFLAFLVVFFFAICHGYYTRTGSAINQRPYDSTSGDAPGAEIPSTIGRDIDRRDYSRGTR